MKSFTIRGIDEDLYNEIRKRCNRQSVSINKFILSILKKELGFNDQKKYQKVYDDLDFLFGRWSQEEYDLITRKIESERTVDKEIWDCVKKSM
ncbi:MAG: antitoxin [Actinobacteria bacterium]|nr:antitoxin [Actinomycetota bacterium]